MKKLLKSLIGVCVLVGAMTFMAPTAVGQLTTFDQVHSRYPIVVGSVAATADTILHYATITWDSLGWNTDRCVGVFVPERDVRVHRIDLFAQDTVGAAGDSAKVYIRSGSALTAQTIWIPYGQKEASYTTRFNIDAGVRCSVFVSDDDVSTGAAEHPVTSGVSALVQLGLQYADR